MSLRMKRFTTAAVLVALYVVLSYVAIDLKVMKLSFAGLSVIVGGLCMGPLAGLEIGAFGAFLEQILRYGFSATTFLWIIPVAVRGLMVGSCAKKKGFALTTFETGLIMVLSAVVVTLLNTGCIYIDSRIYGYYSFAAVFSMIFVRIATGIVTSLVYLLIVPYLVKRLRVFTSQLHQTEGTEVKA